MSDPIEQMAMRAVLETPFCGPAPGSNHWPDLEISDHEGNPLQIDGTAISLAIRRGWLRPEKLDAPGRIIDQDDGPLECMWRYHAEPAMASIFRARKMRGELP